MKEASLEAETPAFTIYTELSEIDIKLAYMVIGYGNVYIYMFTKLLAQY